MQQVDFYDQASERKSLLFCNAVCRSLSESVAVFSEISKIQKSELFFQTFVKELSSSCIVKETKEVLRNGMSGEILIEAVTKVFAS